MMLVRIMCTLKSCDVEAEEKPSAPLQGHTDELWGLAVHPWKPQFLTCGYDRQVCLWDSSMRQLIWTKSLEVGLVNTAPWGQTRELHSTQLTNSEALDDQ